MIRTKIVATLGPATSDAETLGRLFEQSIDVCRLNFSHGDLPDHARMLAAVRHAAERYDGHVAILGDLCGPKIRLGKIEDRQDGGMPINPGDLLHIQREPTLGADGRVSTTYPGLLDDVNVGDRILIEDGLLRFLVIDKTPAELLCSCTAGGILRTAKGINLPHTHIALPSITDKDWQCVDWAIENGLDYLALSFVRKAADLHALRERLVARQADIRIIAKIEKAEALREIDAILDASDGLMVARGDLGVEMDVAQVPIIQKDLIRRCQTAGKPVIVATQMLQSMIDNSSPTRAEVSDVANAIFDGTDAVMLSGETSIGKHPLLAVHTMGHVARTTEDYLHSLGGPLQSTVKGETSRFSAAVARGVRQIVSELDVRLVAIWSRTGTSARIFSKYRFPVPIYAFSTDPRILRRMALYYGVISREMSAPPDMAGLILQVDHYAREHQIASKSDRIIIVAGSAMGTDAVNGIVVHTLGASPAVATQFTPETAQP